MLLIIIWPRNRSTSRNSSPSSPLEGADAVAVEGEELRGRTDSSPTSIEGTRRFHGSIRLAGSPTLEEEASLPLQQSMAQQGGRLRRRSIDEVLTDRWSIPQVPLLHQHRNLKRVGNDEELPRLVLPPRKSKTGRMRKLTCVFRHRRCPWLLTTPNQEDGKPAKRGRRSKRVKAAADSAVPTSTSTPVIPSEDFPKSSEAGPAEAGESVPRKFLPAVPTWSEEEKSTLASSSQFLPFCKLTLVISQVSSSLFLVAMVMISSASQQQYLLRYGSLPCSLCCSLTRTVKTTAQISAFYKTNQDELNLEEVVARAARRSPSSDAAGGSEEPSLKRSGSEVLSNGASSHLSSQAEAVGYPAFPSNYGQPPEYRPLSRTRTMPDGMVIGEDMRIHAPVPYYGSPASMDMHSPYGPPHMHHHHHHPMPPPMTPLMGGPQPHYITNPSPFASPQPPSLPPPSTLTTTFPSNFPYNNLSPSHFAGMPHPSAPPPGGVGMGPGAPYTHPHPPPRVWGPP